MGISFIAAFLYVPVGSLPYLATSHTDHPAANFTCTVTCDFMISACGDVVYRGLCYTMHDILYNIMNLSGVLSTIDCSK